MTSKTGGYITRRLHVPQEVWSQGGAKLTNVPEKIRVVECTPDTLVCCDTGDKIMIRETLHEVMQRAIEYARIIRRPVTD